MSPPEQEGVDRSSEGTTPSTAPNAAPYGAPNAAPAPGPGVSACQQDLRGSWWNEGRENSGGRRSYSATVYVRQYRSYIYAEQDDGTSYYGKCTGSQLQLDVYAGSRFVGYQDGWITTGPRPLGGGPRYEPQPFGADSLYEPPAAAAAPPPPGGSTSARATFTWSTYYGSGSETWTRNRVPRLWNVD
jgi:hypothetical protein